MSELAELYQELILDHSKRPRNFGPLPEANRHANGHNPLCGDKITLHVLLEGDRIRDLRFEGAGCAISTAAASLLTEALKGKDRAAAEALFARFRELVTGKVESEDARRALGKLAVFGGVCEFPMRVKCATLAWHTLLAALDKREESITTE
ncbi:MAG: SUF system NifU family Fe-S cluster assembly protein [Planctomycetes bacterium]|nr:SUF system NifU family Fe-S cluster assembly protein [Planctomycetota bacterium]